MLDLRKLILLQVVKSNDFADENLWHFWLVEDDMWSEA